MAKIGSEYVIVLGHEFKRWHLACSSARAQEITLTRGIGDKALIENTVIAVTEFELVELLGERELGEHGELRCAGLTYWQLELVQNSASVLIKSMRLVEGGELVLKVFANEDGTLVVTGVVSA